MIGSVPLKLLGIVDISAALILIYVREFSPFPPLNLVLAAILLLKGLMSLV